MTKKLTDKQKIKLYQKQLAKITTLAVFCYASQKGAAEILKPDAYTNSDLHTIVSGFQQIMNALGDVTTHEFGHTAGLQHNGNLQSVMYWSIDIDEDRPFPNWHDRQEMRSLYP